MNKPGNPYGHGPKGYFNHGSSKRRIQYASSDERDDALEAEESMKEQQIEKSKNEAIQKELDDWYAIMKDPYSSPYLKEKAMKETRKLEKKLKRGK